MRRFGWILIGAALAGCAGSGGRGELVDPSVYDDLRTSELGTDQTRGVSKEIERQPIGTEIGTTYCGGEVIVDNIVPHDVDDFYNVTVRLRGTRNELAKLQWQIRFYSMQGDPLMGFNGAESWKSAVIEPVSYATLTDACRVRGAVGFRLFVRKAGTNDAGLPDVAENP